MPCLLPRSKLADAPRAELQLSQKQIRSRIRMVVLMITILIIEKTVVLMTRIVVILVVKMINDSSSKNTGKFVFQRCPYPFGSRRVQYILEIRNSKPLKPTA